MELRIDIGRGMFATVDEEVWELSRWVHFKRHEPIQVRPCELSWRAMKNRNYFYAYAKSGAIALHRVVTECAADKVVDHINGDTLDNRLANLRCCLPWQNSIAEHKKRGGYSQYRGVARGSKRNPFLAQVTWTEGGKKRHRCIGSFSTEEEAARAYDVVAAEMFGEFAVLNFPQSPKGTP